MKVKDLMVPIQEYAKVNREASLYDALIALETAQSKLAEGKAPHRAVLVQDELGNLVGNIGRLTFIKALGAWFSTPKTREEMDRAGISPASISTVMSHMRFFHEDLGTLRERAKSIKARDVMHPVGESIDENASLQEAIDMFGDDDVSLIGFDDPLPLPEPPKKKSTLKKAPKHQQKTAKGK